MSISADGSASQWSSATGQRHPPNATPLAPHTLALVSLSVSPDGKRALYNSLEGQTWLWDLESGDVIGTHESYLESNEDVEPCSYLLSNLTSTFRPPHASVDANFNLAPTTHSLVRFPKSKWEHICFIECFWKRHNTFGGSKKFW